MLSPIALPQGEGSHLLTACELHLLEMISLPLFECISPIENVVFVVLAQMDWFNPKSFSCDVKKATFFLSATVPPIMYAYVPNWAGVFPPLLSPN